MNTTLKVALSGAAGLSVVAAVVWLILASIEPATYAAMTDELHTVIEVLLWVSAIGQSLFVIVWATRPWYRHWVGRALMVKTVALALYLDFAVLVNFVDPFPALQLLGVILFGHITVGIWSQVVVIVWEILRHRDGRE